MKLITFEDKHVNIRKLLPLLLLPGIFLLESFLLKGFALRQLHGDLSVLEWLRVWLSDLSFGLIVCALTLLLRMHLTGLGGRIWEQLCYLFWGLSLLLLVVNYFYLRATGSVIPFAVIAYWFVHLHDTNKIIASEMNYWKFSFVALQPILVVVSILIPKLDRLFIRIETKKPRIRSRLIWGFCLAVFIGFVISFIPNPSDRLSAFSHSVLPSLVWDLHQDWSSSVGEDPNLSQETESPVVFDTVIDSRRPNIVLILFESLSWKSSDLYSQGVGATPYLSQLAKKSDVIENLYTVVPHTSKALVSVLCGLEPYLSDETIEAETGLLPKQCLAHILNRFGYRTAFFQPARNFENRDSLVSNMGFLVYRGAFDLPCAGFEVNSYFGFEDNIMLEPSIDWIVAQKNKPYFITYLTLASHHSYITPQSFQLNQDWVQDPKKNAYLNAVRYLDRFIETLLQRFSRLGLLDNTYFFILSDHGEGFGEHGRYQHDFVIWDEGLRGAGLIYSPSYIRSPQPIQGVRSLLDFVPTVVDLLGIKQVAGEFVGTSFFRGVSDERELFHSCTFRNQCLAVRQGYLKTIYHFDKRPMEVYQLRDDPLELHDLSKQLKYTDSFLALQQKKMLAWRNRVQSQYQRWKKFSSHQHVSHKRPTVRHDLDMRLAESIEVLGYDLAPPVAKAGQRIELDLLFRCTQPVPSSQQFEISLQHPDFSISRDEHAMEVYQTCQPGDYIQEQVTFQLPAVWSQGLVDILISIRDTNKNVLLPSYPQGRLLSEKQLHIARVFVTPQGHDETYHAENVEEKIKQWVSIKQPDVATPVNAIFGDRIELVGVTVETPSLRADSNAKLRYVFRALDVVPADWKLAVRFVNRNSKEEINRDHGPIGGLYPVFRWRPGEFVTDFHRAYLGQAGVYEVWLGFRDHSGWVRVRGQGRFDRFNRVHLATLQAFE